MGARVVNRVVVRELSERHTMTLERME